MSNHEPIPLVERLREKGEQVSAAKRNLHGLPILVTESDTQRGKSAMWMDNGLMGIGQVAISAGEFPDEQIDAVAALANVAASFDFIKAAEHIERLTEALEHLVRSVDDLIAESEGVYGLHLNGDPAPWDSLTEGGHLEAWLIDLERAREVLIRERGQ